MLLRKYAVLFLQHRMPALNTQKLNTIVLHDIYVPIHKTTRTDNDESKKCVSNYMSTSYLLEINLLLWLFIAVSLFGLS